MPASLAVLPLAGCENVGGVIDIIVIQFIGQFADKLKWQVEVLMKG